MILIDSFPLFFDSRGSLLAVEFDSIPFSPKRAFLVGNDSSGVFRGGHFARCTEVAVLISGFVVFHTSPNEVQSGDIVLKNVGEAVLIDPEDWVHYSMKTPHSKLLVFADQSFSDIVEHNSA